MTGPTAPASGAVDPLGVVPQLVALAADQAETRSLVAGLSAGVEQLGAEAARLAETDGRVEGRLDEVQAAVTDLSSAVETLGAAGGEGSSPLWVWSEMDVEAQREALTDLAGWVDRVLVDRYRTTREQLPRCWYRHPDVVEELSWLYADWARVYGGSKGASTSSAGEWHDRWRPGVMDRVGRALSGCAQQHKVSHNTPPPGVDAEFRDWLATLGQEPPPPPAAPAGWGSPAPGGAPPPAQQGWYPHQT